jgi:hypothetical protein
MLEKFLVVNVSYTSSITPYQEVSCAVSNDGLRVPLSFGIHTCAETFVPAVASFHSQIADLLPI